MCEKRRDRMLVEPESAEPGARVATRHED
jgi:hypothetical protein